jgi:hypothetical protein
MKKNIIFAEIFLTIIIYNFKYLCVKNLFQRL